MKIMSIFGTRPEAVKMCPLVLAMEQDSSIESVVCLTGQHRQMLQQVIDIFGIRVRYNLDIMLPGQSLSALTGAILQKLEPVLEAEQPDLVLVHGDTTTSFAAALAAFYHQIPVGHVEAGLRTYDRYSPFPEEINRRLTGQLASIHFCPTAGSKKNLEDEGITENVFVTGNTIIDALHTTVTAGYRFKNPQLQKLPEKGKRWILMTAHRRENLGRPLEQICRAAARIAEEFDDVEIIYPVHMNPAVRETAEKILGQVPRVCLTPPLDVEDMHNLLAKSYLVLTDSGGLQEEAPAFGVPLLVLRNQTERPEALQAGTARIAGTDEDGICQAARLLLTDENVYRHMAKAVNPFGDGRACGRILEAIKKWGRL